LEQHPSIIELRRLVCTLRLHMGASPLYIRRSRAAILIDLLGAISRSLAGKKAKLGKTGQGMW